MRWRRRIERVIDRLSNHYIVCGYGRMGAQIGRELTRRGLAFVVIEGDPKVLEMLRESRLRERWGAIVVAIKHQGGECVLSPPADTVLCCGDMLILVASASCWQEIQNI